MRRAPIPRNDIIASIALRVLTSACLALFACSPPSTQPYYLIDHLQETEGDFNRQQFLLIRTDGRLSLPITLEDETRSSLAPPLPSRLAFDVRVPSSPLLRFAIALNPLGDSKFWPPVDFRVLAETGGEVQPLFTESLNRTQAGRWLDREIDLSGWEGRRLRLVLETTVRRPKQRVLWTARNVMPLWGNPVLASKTYRSDRPNLLLVSIDCLRADHVGAYGYHRATTPNIDSLAADGSTFMVAVSTSSWTLPTHFSMLTGLSPSFHGVTQQRKLSPDIPYLPELLSQAGYQVDGVASWYFLSQHFGFDRGFHSYRLMVGSRADRVVDAAVDLVRQAEGRDRFLFVHLIDAHWPYLPPKRWLEHFGPRPADISDLLDKAQQRKKPGDQAEIEQVISLYDAEIAYADEQLGRLVDELRKRDLYDNALIIVTADHGEAFYEHGHWQHTISLYEEVVRIPLIVKWPGNRPKAKVTIPVSQADIFPTILKAAGLDPPTTGALSLSATEGRAAGGRRIVSEVTHPSAGCPETESPGICVKLAMRAGDTKYIATIAEADGELRVLQQELYDLSSDPEERNDLTQIERADARLFQEEVRAFVTAVRKSRAGGEEVILDEEIKETLRSLGYINQ